MIKMLSQAAMLAACGFRPGGMHPQTTCSGKKTTAADYQAEVRRRRPPPASRQSATTRAISAPSERMVQGESRWQRCNARMRAVRAHWKKCTAAPQQIRPELVNNTVSLNSWPAASG